MKRIKITIIVLILTIWAPALKAQESNNTFIKKSYADSLITEFDNTVYNAFYTPRYMDTKTATFTLLKVDIDESGKVSKISFSDSADSVFVNAWTNKKQYHNDKATLEKYAKAKSYQNISLLIPVSFEPNAPNQNKQFSYDQMESLLKFDKKDFTGKCVILAPVFIPVLSNGNM